MIYHRSFVLILTFILCIPLAGQQTPPTSTQQAQRDPQALTVVTQAISAAGGQAALSEIQDFAGTGTVTFNWAGEAVQGNATVKGRGIRQFRLDASLPDGVQTWAVNNGQAFKKESDGTVTQVPYYNAMSFESLTHPCAHLLAAFQDSSVSISYVGLETMSGNQVHHIRIQTVVAPSQNPGGIRSKLSRKDFIIDAATLSIIAIQDVTHPPDQVTKDYPHELRFSEYQKVSGVLVPFSITEISSGQPTFTIQLNQINFNTGLSDADFQQ